MMYALTFSETYFVTDPGCQEDHEHFYCNNESTGVSVTPGGLYRSKPQARMGYYAIDADRPYEHPYGVDDVPPGETAYVVIVEYTDGDTFGSSGHWCVAGLFDSPEKAAECADLCGKDDFRGRKWDGYFAGFDNATVYPMVVVLP